MEKNLLCHGPRNAVTNHDRIKIVWYSGMRWIWLAIFFGLKLSWIDCYRQYSWKHTNIFLLGSLDVISIFEHFTLWQLSIDAAIRGEILVVYLDRNSKIEMSLSNKRKCVPTMIGICLEKCVLCSFSFGLKNRSFTFFTSCLLHKGLHFAHLSFRTRIVTATLLSEHGY